MHGVHHATSPWRNHIIALLYTSRVCVCVCVLVCDRLNDSVTKLIRDRLIVFTLILNDLDIVMRPTQKYCTHSEYGFPFQCHYWIWPIVSDCRLETYVGLRALSAFLRHDVSAVLNIKLMHVFFACVLCRPTVYARNKTVRRPHGCVLWMRSVQCWNEEPAWMSFYLFCIFISFNNSRDMR